MGATRKNSKRKMSMSEYEARKTAARVVAGLVRILSG
jgi:hypothetical protein